MTARTPSITPGRPGSGGAKAAASEPKNAQADALAFADVLHDWQHRARKLTEASARAALIRALRDAHALGLLNDVDVDALASPSLAERMTIAETYHAGPMKAAPKQREE
jgi:hypothetical protein